MKNKKVNDLMEDDDMIFKPKYKHNHDNLIELKESNTSTYSNLDVLKSKEDDYDDIAFDF